MLPAPPQSIQLAKRSPKLISLPEKWAENSLMIRIWKERAANPKQKGGANCFTSVWIRLGPDSGYRRLTGFAFSSDELYGFYHVSSPPDDGAPAAGTIGVFGFMAGNITDKNLVEPFLKCCFIRLLKR